MTGVQLALGFPDYQAPVTVVGASHKERWEQIKSLNPWIVDAFLSMAHEARDAGMTRLGVKWLTEVYRWRRLTNRGVGDSYKWNNNHTAYLARDLIAADPTLAGMIETRDKKKAA